MGQISIHTVPTIPIRIPKKTAEISWLSDVVTRETNSLDNKNIRSERDFKKIK